MKTLNINFRKVNVLWDTDGISPEEIGLPLIVEVPVEIAEEEISDWLSDNYGYCVYSWVEL